MKLSIVALLLFCSNVWADSTLRFVTPWAVGGGIDTVTRHLATGVEKRMSVNVIVENRRGANGAVAAAYVVRSPTNQNVFLVDQVNTYLNHWLQREHLQYNPFVDLVPVAQIAEQYSLLVVHPSVPAESVDSLVGLAKRHQGKLTFGHGGVGNTNYILINLISKVGGATFHQVPYKAGTDALLDLVGGRIDATIANATVVLPLVQSARIKPIAKFTRNSLPGVLRTVPVATVNGKPLTYTANIILFAPATTNRALIETLRGAVADVVSSKAFVGGLEQAGSSATFSSGSALQQKIDDDVSLWKSIGLI